MGLCFMGHSGAADTPSGDLPQEFGITVSTGKSNTLFRCSPGCQICVFITQWTHSTLFLCWNIPRYIIMPNVPFLTSRSSNYVRLLWKLKIVILAFTKILTRSWRIKLSLFALLACQLLGKQGSVVANLISSNVEKRKFLHQSAILTALGKGSYRLASPKNQN